MRKKGKQGSCPISKRAAAEKTGKSKCDNEETKFGSEAMAGVHPLMIDHVLEKIFEYLFWPEGKPRQPKFSPIMIQDAEAMKVRLVCKQWHDVGTRLFRRHRKPIAFDLYYSARPNEKSADVFLNVMKKSSLIPAEAYEFGANVFGGPVPPGRRRGGSTRGIGKVLLEFLRVCGPSLVKLDITLYGSCTLNTSSFPPIFLPSLKELSFTAQIKEPPKSRHEEIILLFLKAAINLQEFDLDLLLNDDVVGLRMCSSLLKAVFHNLPATTKALALSDVLMSATESENLFEILISRRLRLEELYFRWRGHVRAESVLALLETQTTLKELHLGTLNLTGSSHNKIFEIPTLPHLEKLGLLDIGVRLLPTGPQKELLPFPRLRKVDMSYWPGTEADTCHQFFEATCGGKPDQPPLREVALPSFTTAELMTKIGAKFSNLRRLFYSTSFGSSYSEFVPIVHAIFQHCVNLEMLCVSYPPPIGQDEEIFNPENMDSLLSGIPEEDCVRLRTRRRNLGALDISKLQKTPSIRNLTKLRRLRLMKRYEKPFFIVTPMTAQLVFLRMESLAHLRVDMDAHHPHLSPKVRGLLHAKFKPEEYYNTDGYDEDWNF